MSRTDWACLLLIIGGFLLFLLGANVYNAIVGYFGLFMFIGAIIAYLFIYAYKEILKKPSIQKL